MTKEERINYFIQSRQNRGELEERLARAQKQGMRVIVDCGFEINMSVKENKSLAVQISRVYGTIKSSPFDWCLWVTNI